MNKTTTFMINGHKGYWEVSKYSYDSTSGAIVIHAPIIFRTKKSAKNYIREVKLDLKSQA